MAISTYSELQTAVQNWLDDSDGNALAAARVQEFIALAEADFNRRIRCRENLTSATGTTVAATETISLPARFGGVQTFLIADNGYYRPLALMNKSAATEAYYGYGSGVPTHFVVESSTIRLYPTPDGAYAYRLSYWQRVLALSDAFPTNWLLTAHPDVYLFGSLVHAEGFLVDDARLQAWRLQYELALEQVTQGGVDFGGRSLLQPAGERFCRNSQGAQVGAGARGAGEIAFGFLDQLTGGFDAGGAPSSADPAGHTAQED